MIRLSPLELEIQQRYEAGEDAAKIARSLGRHPTGVQSTVRALYALKLIARAKSKGGRPRKGVRP
jgi:DNA-binding CsgD family transcriptional regulator